MSILYQNSSLFTLSAIILMIAAVGTFLKRTLWVNSGKLLLSFSVLVLVCCLTFLAVEIRPGAVQTKWISIFPAVSLILLIPPLVLIGRLGLQSKGSIRSILVSWLAWIGLYVLVLPTLPLSNRLLGDLLNPQIRTGLPNAILIIGWVVMAVYGFQDLRKGMQNSDSNLIQKRARLWVLVWVSVLLSGILLLTSQIGWGLLSMSLSTAAAAYLLLAQDLPYPRFLVRKIISFIFVFIPLTLITWTGYYLIQRLQINLPVYGAWIPVVLLVLINLATMFLIFRLTSRLLDRWIPFTQYDLTHILHEYSQQVSLLTSPGKLSRITIDLINNTIGLDFGHIFEVLSDPTSTQNKYRIEDSGGTGKVTASSLIFSQENPIPDYFHSNRRPIRIDEIKKLISADKFSREEIAWFTNPQIELLIPICSKEDWVGLFALGAKKSGEAYTIDDFTLLNTITNQLSFSFQNARMVETLMRINNDFRRTYSAMDQANHQIRQAYDQLEKIDKTKSDFISVASHELRTPLTVMRGYNEMLLEDPTVNANAYQLKMLKGENAGMVRMQEVIDSMLDVASIDSRTLRLQKEILSINTITEDVIDYYSSALAERNIKIKTENLQYLPSIQADHNGLNKVFTQLLSNAIKYSPDGGEITISGTLLSSDQTYPKNDVLRIAIRDTGIGIDKDQLQLIFNKFYQTGKVELHSTGKTKYKGSGPGLGLAIAKGIIEAHEGKLWAESSGHDENNFPGSVFHIELPLSNEIKLGTLPLQI